MTWGEEVRDLIFGLPSDEFTLSELYANADSIRANHPSVVEWRSVMRNRVHNLRDAGLLEHIDRGTYRRLDIGEPEVVSLGATPPVPRDDDNDGAPDSVPLEHRKPPSSKKQAAAEAVALQREQTLTNAFEEALAALGHEYARWRIPTKSNSYLFTDVWDSNDNVLYEAKGLATREAVRLALGQLLDYARYLKKNPPKLSVLLPERPSADMIDLLGLYNVGCTYQDPSDGTFKSAWGSAQEWG
jgi:hypothetical protein